MTVNLQITQKLLVAIVSFVVVLLSADLATASEVTDPGENASISAQQLTDEQWADKESGKTNGNKKGNNKAKGATFVDKDGDGIHDGKEYRFRNKSKFGTSKNRRQLMKKRKRSGGKQGAAGASKS